MQNTSTHILFDPSASEALHYTSLKDSQYKFSILDQIDNINRYSSSVYEFLLCYPELDVCNHWTQTSSPLQYTENDSSKDGAAVGLQELDPRFQLFKGLMKSKQSATFLDGCKESTGNWGYSVGMYSNIYDYKIPGPRLNDEWHYLYVYELYLRVPSIRFTCNISNYIKIKCSIVVITVAMIK